MARLNLDQQKKSMGVSFSKEDLAQAFFLYDQWSDVSGSLPVSTLNGLLENGAVFLKRKVIRELIKRKELERLRFAMSYGIMVDVIAKHLLQNNPASGVLVSIMKFSRRYRARAWRELLKGEYSDANLWHVAESCPEYHVIAHKIILSKTHKFSMILSTLRSTPKLEKECVRLLLERKAPKVVLLEAIASTRTKTHSLELWNVLKNMQLTFTELRYIMDHNKLAPLMQKVIMMATEVDLTAEELSYALRYFHHTKAERIFMRKAREYATT